MTGALAAILFVLSLSWTIARADSSPAPTPTPTEQPDPCGETDLLATLNRPTVGFSACAVKPHTLLAEAGYAVEINTGSTPAINTTYPQTFSRFGFRKNLELDVLGPAFDQTSSGGTTTSGSSDSGVGIKYEFYHDDKNVAALDGLVTFPTGSGAYTAGGPGETINLDASHAITDHLGAGVTIGFASLAGTTLAGEQRRFWTVLPSAVLTYNWASRYQTYFEYYAQTRLRPDGGQRHAIDGGLQFLATPSLEIDFEAGHTQTDFAQSHYYGFGLGVKF
ncbi:MAG: hypothetical protein DLM50_02965 [Candidatus Meridianibacter frigidus]|nr:MAG: hypothetical protein DLM50_02965 [Candidatus Eremiobacteraeota bacterium]